MNEAPDWKQTFGRCGRRMVPAALPYPFDYRKLPILARGFFASCQRAGLPLDERRAPEYAPVVAKARVALPTRKREPRQARKGATVAWKRVAGPYPYLGPALPALADRRDFR